MKSNILWQDKIKLTGFKSLNKDIKTDILIIGGGICGINIFYQLKDLNKAVTLVERNNLGMGVTSRSTAKITFLQQDIYSKIAKAHDNKTAEKYFVANKKALKAYETIIKKENIDCDFEKVDSYLFTDQESEVNKIKKEEALIKSFGEKTYKTKVLPDGKLLNYGFYCKNTYVFHPVKYVQNLAKVSTSKEHNIYENTKVNNIEEKDGYYVAYTNDYKITCQTVILACHYPFFLIPYLFPMKVWLEKSYIMAYKDHNNFFSAINLSTPVYSVRFYKDYKLHLSSSHNLALAYDYAKNFTTLIGDKKIAYAWSNEDIMTKDHLPYIGKIKDNMYLATGFNTWGMTGSMIASLLIKDLIMGKNIHNIFNPKRTCLIGAVSLFSNTYSFTLSKTPLKKQWLQNNPYYTKIDDTKVAIFTDKEGKRYIVKSLCPHLKCTLNFNKVEETWDCPCHASRFTKDGKYLKGPSLEDITYHE